MPPEIKPDESSPKKDVKSIKEKSNESSPKKDVKSIKEKFIHKLEDDETRSSVNTEISKGPSVLSLKEPSVLSKEPSASTVRSSTVGPSAIKEKFIHKLEEEASMAQTPKSTEGSKGPSIKSTEGSKGPSVGDFKNELSLKSN